MGTAMGPHGCAHDHGRAHGPAHDHGRALGPAHDHGRALGPAHGVLLHFYDNFYKYVAGQVCLAKSVPAYNYVPV